MPDKTKTIVVIESHEQTTIRRTRRTTTAEMVCERGVTRPSGSKSVVEFETAVPRSRWPVGLDRSWFSARCQAIVLKTATVLAPLSRRLKARADQHRNRIS